MIIVIRAENSLETRTVFAIILKYVELDGKLAYGFWK